MTGLDKKTVPAALDFLKSNGWIGFERRNGVPPNYEIHLTQKRASTLPENGYTRKRVSTLPENGPEPYPKTGTEPKKEPKKKLKGVDFSANEIELPPEVNSKAWLDWCDYRRERKPVITERSAKLTINLLAEYDSATQLEMVNSSIRSGWQGVFPPRGNYQRDDSTQLQEIML